jgi:hypothetical protein
LSGELVGAWDDLGVRRGVAELRFERRDVGEDILMIDGQNILENVEKTQSDMEWCDRGVKEKVARDAARSQFYASCFTLFQIR